MHGFRFYFTPGHGFFSPFPRGTRSLSVASEYLALESGLPGFLPDFTCPAVLRNSSEVASLLLTGLSPFLAALSRALQLADDFNLTALNRMSPTTPEQQAVRV